MTWNNSLVYATTAAYYATWLAGAPPLHPVGGNVPPFSGQQTRVLRALRVRRGFEVGGVDGKVGTATRAAVKAMQLKLGVPADSYPTPELSGMAAHGTLDSGHIGAAGYNVSCGEWLEVVPRSRYLAPAERSQPSSQ